MPKKALVGWLAILLLVGCQNTSTGTEADSPDRASEIVCYTAYRASSGVPIEAEESIMFSDKDEQGSLSFSDLDFHAQYGAGEQNRERNLRLRVTATSIKDELTSQLYQFPLESGPQNQFVGGHGFTGLSYVYHPVSGAELQFWCEAGG